MTTETLTPLHHRAAHHDPAAARQAVEMFEAEEKRKDEAREVTRGRVLTVGRLMLATMFAVTGFDKLINFSASARHLFNMDVNDPEFVIFASLVIEIAGALFLALGWKTRRIAVGLAGYLGFVSLLALAYFPPEFSKLFLIANVGVVGGLLALVANGAGPLSLDARQEKKEAIARAS